MTLGNQIAVRFRAMPIRQKLRLIFIVSTGIALLLAGLGIVAADAVQFYGYLRRDLATFVKIIGDNSTAALAFKDAKAASETLGALRARTHVESACLYYDDGTILAEYRRPDYKGTCPHPAGEQIQPLNQALVASHEVYLADRRIGSLVLQYDLDEIGERMRLHGATVLAALLLSSIIASILSAKLRALIAEPILELAGTAKAVSQTKDYGLRAKKLSGDELGVLADALNQMMEGIQARDDDLRTALKDQQDALTRMAQLNATLQRSNAELARSNQDFERVAFVASHDLQEPLRMITSYSQLLVTDGLASQGERSTEFVKQIVGGTKRMRELLADLLAYAEIAGSGEPPLEVVDSNSVLQRVTQTLAARITETQAEISADELPVFMAHEARMTSLFLNLIGNAIKYRSEERPRIHVSVQDGADHFTFAVTDNGIGIAPEYHQKIFVAFKRLHGRDIPGTGIGLAICQRIVERYGGRIWVESTSGAGATFRFTLPRSTTEVGNNE